MFGVESDAFSAFEFGAAGIVVEVAGDSLTSLTGVSSLIDSGSTMARSFLGVVLRVTTSVVLVVEVAPVMAAAVVLDFRRSLDTAAFLLEGGMFTEEQDDDGKRGAGAADAAVGDGDGDDGN